MHTCFLSTFATVQLIMSCIIPTSSLWTILVWTILPCLVFCNNAVVNRAKRRADALRKVNRMPDLLRPRGLAATHQHSLLRRMHAEMIYHRDKVSFGRKKPNIITRNMTHHTYRLLCIRLLTIWCMRYE